MKSVTYKASYNSVLDYIFDTIIKVSKENNFSVEPTLLCGNLLSFRVKGKDFSDEVIFVIRQDHDSSVIIDVFSRGDFEWRV